LQAKNHDRDFAVNDFINLARKKWLKAKKNANKTTIVTAI